MKIDIQGNNQSLPLIVSPESGQESSLRSLEDWMTSDRPVFDRLLTRHGALLLRGFQLSDELQFREFCQMCSGSLKDYAGGDSPRHRVGEGVYTSTEYPAALQIPLHNEMSYLDQWPRQLFFFSLRVADEGGQTPLADGRRVWSALGADVREEFERRGVSYLQTLHGGWGLGRSWQATFETRDREAVDRFCRDHAIEARWQGDVLHTKTRRPATITHPVTGERAWFNQAHLWHCSSRGPQIAARMLRTLGEENLPQHARFADDGEIPMEMLDHVRAVLGEQEVVFDWRTGDLLVIDNAAVLHGRRSFRGERRVLVAMG